jgi:hypothetical protein
MSHLKKMTRKFKNGFRAENTFKIASAQTNPSEPGKKAKIPKRKLK